MRVALIHDWLTGMRGGEAVLEAMIELFPEANLFTLITIPENISAKILNLKRKESLLQRIPGAKRRYRHFLPIMPSLIERLDMSGYDLILSSSHCVAKGIKKPPRAVHVSYVHAPMRYMWDRYNDYFGSGRMHWTARLAARVVRRYLQKWDISASTPERVDLMIANSQFIKKKIEQIYQRPATVVYPFTDLDRFRKYPQTAGLLLSRSFGSRSLQKIRHSHSSIE